MTENQSNATAAGINNPLPKRSREYNQGYSGFFAGAPLAACPYFPAHPIVMPPTQKINAWLSGWLDAEADVAAYLQQAAGSRQEST